MKNKTLQELTLKDNFMFSAVMTDESICREFLEIALGIPVSQVTVSKEKCIVYHPEYKGVRLDVYAEDEENTHYNVEMQVAEKPALSKRCRYYHSQIDMELLTAGKEYSSLPEVVVIFVCDFDPFWQKKYCYTFENHCLEDDTLALMDGCKSIFLSTHGENPEEVSAELVAFLKFIHDGNYEGDSSEQSFIRRLQESVRKIKASREMGERFMLFKEMLKEEHDEGYAEGREEGRAEAKAEDILMILRTRGSIPDALEQRIRKERDLDRLEHYFRVAVQSASMESFINSMNE